MPSQERQRRPDHVGGSGEGDDARRARPHHSDPMRVWFRFVRLNRRLGSAVANALRELGLSIPQFDVISTLTEKEGLTQKELARRLYVTKSNVSGLIDRLVEAGLVERRPLPGDRRSHALYLTADGSRLAREGMRVQTRYVERTLGTLTATDLDALEGAIVRWRDAVKGIETA